MAITLSGRTIPIVPRDGQMNLRDPNGTGSFDPNDAGEIYFNNETKQVDEDIGTAEITVVRTGGTGSASVDYSTQDGTALAGTSYTSSSGTLNWSDGETGSKNISVSITDRTGDEQGDLDFSVVLNNPVGAPIREKEDGGLLDTSTVTIRDLDPPTSNKEATIVWNGDFSDGLILQQYPTGSYWGVIDAYEPPPAFDGQGDGTQLNLVTPGGAGAYFDGPVRSGNYAVRFRLPNSAEGGDSQADPLTNDSNRRRTEIHQKPFASTGQGLHFNQTRWFSCSYYIPSDWDISFNSTRLLVLQIKHSVDNVPTFALKLSDSWEIRNSWSPETNPSHSDIEWWMHNDYKPNMSSTWDDLLPDFPDESTSKNALASVNRGGWTDWVVRVRPDHRSAQGQGITFDSGGDGELDVWKREDNGPWVHVLRYLPRVITVSGNTYSRGVWVHDSNETYYLRCGMYATLGANAVLDADPSREFIFDNYRIYEGDSTLEGIEGVMT